MKINLPQLNKVIDVEKDANLFRTLKEAQVPIASSCNGDGVCGKCIVNVITGHLPSPNTLELSLIEKYNLDKGQRISCQCHVVSDIKITTGYW